MNKNRIIIILSIIIVILCGVTFNLYCNNKKIESIKKDNTTVEKRETKEINTEDYNKVIGYIEELNSDIEIITNKEDISEKEENKLKDIFITLTDFIFYNGEIKGKTFSELTNELKNKVINIYENIDLKIESRFPNYKEKIKDNGIKSYINVKSKLKEIKNNIIDEYKNKVGEERFNIIKDTYEDGKKDIDDVYNEYKPIIEEGKETGKSIIIETKERISKWYKEYKEG